MAAKMAQLAIFAVWVARTFAVEMIIPSEQEASTTSEVIFTTQAAGPQCDTDNLSCPSCDGSEVTDDAGNSYAVLCHTIPYCSGGFVAGDGQGSISNCLSECDARDECQGAFFWNGANCQLCTGQYYYPENQPGFTAFIPISSPTVAAMSSTRIRTTTTRIMTETIIPLPVNNATSTSNAATSTATSCSAISISCPICDNTTVTDFAGDSYEVHCDSILSASALYGDSTRMTALQCMHECDFLEGCFGAWIGDMGVCELATGVNEGLIEDPGFTAFLAVSSVAATRTSSSARSTRTASSTRSATRMTGSRSSTRTGATSTASSCSYSSIDCPVCDHRTITDPYGIQYQLFCSSILQVEDSSDIYALAQPLPPQQCIAQCDKLNADALTSNCTGAYWEGEECHLATGRLLGPASIPGSEFIAFVPVSGPAATAVPSVSASLSFQNMSRFPTGQMYTPSTASASRLSYMNTSHSAATATSQAPASETCNFASISCPACDGLAVVDSFNETYRVQCNFEPTCQDLVGYYGPTSLNVCMQRCDADATCLAAIYNDGHCDLCQRSMEGRYGAQNDYIVLVPAPRAASTAVSLGTPSASTGSITAARTTLASSASVVFANATAVTGTGGFTEAPAPFTDAFTNSRTISSRSSTRSSARSSTRSTTYASTRRSTTISSNATATVRTSSPSATVSVPSASTTNAASTQNVTSTSEPVFSILPIFPTTTTTTNSSLLVSTSLSAVTSWSETAFVVVGTSTFTSTLSSVASDPASAS